MKELSRLFALLMIAGATLTFTACSDDEPEPEPEDELSATEQALIGDWVMASEAGAFAIGPNEGSAEWFFNSEDDVTTRACFFDDVYTFNADKSFSIELGSATWLEGWQGAEPDACGTPIAPHDGSGTYAFGATETTISLEGVGAYLGLAKVINNGELTADSTVPGTRTYKILEFNSDTTPKTLKLDVKIVTGDGADANWTFNLVSQ